MAEVKSKKRESEKFFTFRRFVKFFPRGGVAGVVFGESRKRGLGGESGESEVRVHVPHWWEKMRPGCGAAVRGLYPVTAAYRRSVGTAWGDRESMRPGDQ
jgi:hypothetical protein